MVLIKNSKHNFINSFLRLNNYETLQNIREELLPCKLINMESNWDEKDKFNYKYLVITSTSADDIHKSIKYGIWTSPKNTNKKLIDLFEEKKKDPLIRILLFFKVLGKNEFCGVAELISSYIEE